MSTALLLTITLIALAPAVLGLDGTLALGLWSAALALALVAVANNLQPAEADHLSVLVRYLALAAMVPAVFILWQTLPLPNFLRLNNPIWQSVGTALGRPVTGSISIDTGSTLLSLCRYLASLGVGLVACAVSIDRQRAESVLFAATLVTTLTAALLIANDLAGFAWLDATYHAAARGGALDVAALGCILSVACCIRAYERFETRRTGNEEPPRLDLIIILCFAAFVICGVALALDDGINTPLAAACGLTTLLGVFLIRRIGLGQVGALIAVVVVCVITLEIAVARLGQSQENSDLTLRFSASSSPARAVTERMLADSKWSGTGAGSYRTLVPIYRGPDDRPDDLDPPTAAAQTAVEVGRPLLWVAVLASCVMVVMLFRAGLRRGRDSFFPAAGSAAVVTLLISAFGNDGLFQSSVLIVAGAIIGLAVAQSRSRTTR